jgi:hypothetical protein
MWAEVIKKHERGDTTLRTGNALALSATAVPTVIRDKEGICGHIDASATVISTILCMYDRRFKNIRDFCLNFMQNMRYSYSKSTLSKIKFFRLDPLIIFGDEISGQMNEMH